MFNRRPRFRRPILDSNSAQPSPLETLESRQLFSATAISALTVTPSIVDASVTQGSVIGYTASQLKAAYGISGTGAGQTIAIIDAYNDPNLSADLSVFDKAMGLSSASLTIESQTGSTTALPASNASWALETSLDVEWAHAVAPSAKILLVEASSSSLGNLLSAVNLARSSRGVSVVSMSWGSSEFLGETSYDSYFTTPSGHSNVTFVASSGDDGYVEWPSASSNVVAVGGTTLTISSGKYSTEVGWHDSGGGYSVFEAEPAYQSTVQSTGVRTTPDVAYDANPSTGVAVYDSLTYDGESGWFELGGTSAGAPQWSGIVAIADQTRASGGKTLLTSAGVLNALYATYSSSSTYSTDFHDITSGTSFGKSATTGYDLVTGLGSPKASAVDSTLGSFTGSESSTTTTRTPPRPFPLGAAFGRAVSVASTTSGGTFETDSATFDSTASGSFSAGPFLQAIDRLNQALAQLSVPVGADGSAVELVASMQPPTEAQAWLSGASNRDENWNVLSGAAAVHGDSAPVITADAAIHADAITAVQTALPTGASGITWTMAQSAFSSSALMQTATHFGSAMISTLEDPAARSFQVAAAAAIAGAGFLWWWTEPQRDEDQNRRTSAATELFCRKMIEVTTGSHGVFA